MKNVSTLRFRTLLLVVITFLLIAQTGFSSSTASKTDITVSSYDIKPIDTKLSTPIPGVIYVKLNSRTDASSSEKINDAVLKNLAQINPLKILSVKPVFQNINSEKADYGLNRWVSVEIPKDVDILSTVNKLKEIKDFEYVEPSYPSSYCIIPNDTNFSQQWGLHNIGQNGGTPDADIDAPESWDINFGDADVVVAVPDLGIDYNHNDLSGNMWINTDEFIGDANDDGYPGIQGVDDDHDGLIDEDSEGRQPGDTGYTNDLVNDDDENGFVDDIRGWDFGSNDNDPIQTYYTHGTKCAGIIGAVGDNTIGVTGVSWICKIMPLKITPGYFPDITACANSIIYASDNGADVISMSWVQPHQQVLADAVQYAYEHGVVLVGAAGNSNSSQQDFYPAGYEHVIAVGATDHDDVKAGFSNYGDWVDIAAPGVDIYTTTIQNGYAYMDGTSAACPVVAGVSALLCSYHSDLTPDLAKTIIYYTADSTTSLLPKRINAYSALTAEYITDICGIVQFIPLEGGFYGIISDDGQHYAPVNLPNEYRISGLHLSFSGCLLYLDDIHMWGQDIALADITILDDIIYVDDDFTDQTPGWGVDHFNTIQAGVDAMNTAGLVYVFSGIYYENVGITQTMTLSGEDKYTTIIDGNNLGDVIHVYPANGVRISGFTLQHSASRFYAAIFLHSNNNIISGNIIKDNPTYGIFIYRSSGNIIEENIISNTTDGDGPRDGYGIVDYHYGYESGDTTIVRNTFTGNDYGIDLSYSTGTIIRDNTIENSRMKGIALWSAHDNSILNNAIIESTMWGGITLTGSQGNIISGNYLNDHIEGIYFYMSSENIIVGNTIRNTQDGIYLRESSMNNQIYHNNFLITRDQHAYDECTNFWDNGYPSGGNYWDTYTGVDNNHGINQNIPGSDNIGDTPYSIPNAGNQDTYPLIGMYQTGSVINQETGEQFRTIQDAINDPATLNGHTIHVGPGTYYEHPIINKEITLEGENAETTIIDGDYSGDIITITVPGVTIKGFTIQNSGNLQTNAGITVVSDNSQLIENVIKNDGAGTGIYVEGASGTKILQNTISSYITGMRLESDSHNNEISKNAIYDSGYGIICSDHSYNNYIAYNNILVSDQHARDPSNANVWKANYWSDYRFMYPAIDENEDGFWDTPYYIPESIDTYDYAPLVTPYDLQIHVVSPNGGEFWFLNFPPHYIRWESNGLSGEIASVYIQWKPDSDWFLLETVTNQAGLNELTVGINPPDNNNYFFCKIKVEITSIPNPEGQPLISDTTDSYFAVISNMATPYLVISPNGGETLEAGKTYDLTWASEMFSDDKVSLWISTNSGEKWLLINNCVNTPGLNIYKWRIPKKYAGTNCRIKVSSVKNPELYFDVSDADFIIK